MCLFGYLQTISTVDQTNCFFGQQRGEHASHQRDRLSLHRTPDTYVRAEPSAVCLSFAHFHVKACLERIAYHKTPEQSIHPPPVAAHSPSTPQAPTTTTANMSREAYTPPSLSQNQNQFSGQTGAANTGFDATSTSFEDTTKPVHYLCGDCDTKVTLKRGDPIRCKECGYRVLYKERTNRYVPSWSGLPGWWNTLDGIWREKTCMGDALTCGRMVQFEAR